MSRSKNEQRNEYDGRERERKIFRNVRIKTFVYANIAPGT